MRTQSLVGLEQQAGGLTVAVCAQDRDTCAGVIQQAVVFLTES